MPEYRKVTVDELPDAPNPTRHKKEVDEAVGANAFGFNVYVGEPGELVPWGYHRHPDHEELFYVLEGQLTVETPVGDYTVEGGEAFFVPPDAPNKATVTSEEPARFIAVGAPKSADGSVIRETCEHCGDVTGRESSREGEAVVLSCAECGNRTTRFAPGPATD